MRGHLDVAAWLLAALLLAAAVRLPRVLATDFPINDGGIFYVMTRELASAGLSLPVSTGYNNSGLPFAYPPLGLYVAAALHLATGASILTLQRTLPLLANLLAVAAFFFLARRILASTSAAGLAALVFVTLPRSYEWLIMGGGLTRSFGFLFLCLAVLFGHRALVGRHRRSVVPAAICLALAVLSHPEMGIVAAAWLVVLTLSDGFDRWRMIRALALAGGAVVLVAPWLTTVLVRHGLSPFRGAAGNSGFWLRGSLARLASPEATGEVGLPLLACLALLGAVLALARREFLLPGWVLATFVLTPRAAPTPATVPLAMLAALALRVVVRPGIASALTAHGAAVREDAPALPRRPFGRERLAGLVYGATVAVVIGYTLVSSNLGRSTASWETMRSVPQPEREAMAWVAGHTPPSSRFVVASTATSWTADPVDAWFPALTSRASVATPNGAEWLPRGEFTRREEEYSWLKGCQAVNGACLDSLETAFGVRFTHVYVSKPAAIAAAPCPCASPADSGEFVAIYDGPGATIYARR
jgi:6-pyruvoyl-tetrahydropterin synthase related domain